LKYCFEQCFDKRSTLSGAKDYATLWFTPIMGDGSEMRKADLLDEIRAEIGVVSDRLGGSIERLYRFVPQVLYEKVSAYRYVGVYLTSGYQFTEFYGAGCYSLMTVVPFGCGLHSVAAARGGVVREQTGDQVEVYVPFYRGHHLIGELVVVGTPVRSVDEEDIALFCEIASLLETKVEECNS
jgi:L-methionine (R)-S-oxide reductase